MDYLQYLKRFNKNIKILNENELEKIPQCWKYIMLSENRLERVVEYWKEVVGGSLSNTIRYIENHLIDIQCIKVNEDYYILYNILTENKEEGIYVGKIPNENKKISCIYDKLPKSLQTFYSNLHDGFYYFASDSMGILELSMVKNLNEYDWAILEEIDEPKINLDTSYIIFDSGMVGFIVVDVNKGIDDATIWFDDEAPMYQKNFWNFCDEWIKMGMEE